MKKIKKRMTYSELKRAFTSGDKAAIKEANEIIRRCMPSLRRLIKNLEQATIAGAAGFASAMEKLSVPKKRKKRK